MTFPKYKELNNLTDVIEIEKEIFVVQKTLFDLRMKKSTVNTIKPHLFKHAKRRLAHLHLKKSFLLKLKE